MEQNTEGLINVDELAAYINAEWAQSMSRANQKIAHLIVENKIIHEENKGLKSEINRLKDQKPAEK